MIARTHESLSQWKATGLGSCRKRSACGRVLGNEAAAPVHPDPRLFRGGDLSPAATSEPTGPGRRAAQLGGASARAPYDQWAETQYGS
jgi:hypothetical protein